VPHTVGAGGEVTEDFSVAKYVMNNDTEGDKMLYVAIAQFVCLFPPFR